MSKEIKKVSHEAGYSLDNEPVDLKKYNKNELKKISIELIDDIFDNYEKYNKEDKEKALEAIEKLNDINLSLDIYDNKPRRKLFPRLQSLFAKKRK